MDISKIYVTVDKRDYSGLYWVTQEKGKPHLHVSYAGVKQLAREIDKAQLAAVEQTAKQMLSELIDELE